MAALSSRPTKSAIFGKCRVGLVGLFFSNLDRRGGEVGGSAGCGSVGYLGKLV